MKMTPFGGISITENTKGYIDFLKAFNWVPFEVNTQCILGDKLATITIFVRNGTNANEILTKDSPIMSILPVDLNEDFKFNPKIMSNWLMDNVIGANFLSDQLTGNQKLYLEKMKEAIREGDLGQASKNVYELCKGQKGYMDVQKSIKPVYTTVSLMPAQPKPEGWKEKISKIISHPSSPSKQDIGFGA